ncbi:MAG: hypothetical protein CMM60_09710 [Rhodospirillaceae bacterium]|nr:hypothetical protein [Rhodospirillaceae bacterium]
MTAHFDQIITEMMKLVKSRAEEAFAMFNRQQEKETRKEKKKVRQEKAEHVAGLRGLRLAKEAAKFIKRRVSPRLAEMFTDNRNLV